MERVQNERACEISMLSDGELVELMRVTNEINESQLLAQEFESRLEAKKAQERADVVARIIVHDCNCQCGACGYGGSSWTWMCEPGREELVPIRQESKACPGCGARFIGRRLADDARQPAPGYRGDRL